MIFAPLCVFWNDVPNVRKLCAILAIFQEIEALVLQLLGAAGELYGIAVGGPSRSSNHHAKIRDLPDLHKVKHFIKSGHGVFLLFICQFCRELYFALIPHAGNSGSRDNSTMLDTLSLARERPRRIEVVVISLWLLREKEDGFPQRPHFIFGVIGSALYLVPHHLIPERKADFVSETDSDTLRNHQ